MHKYKLLAELYFHCALKGEKLIKNKAMIKEKKRKKNSCEIVIFV